MKILVTGATGFLGGAFARAAAAEGHEVCALARRGTSALEAIAGEIVVADVRSVEPEALPSGLDAIVHFATATGGDESEMLDVAVTGTLTVYGAALTRRVPLFVHVSSASVYPGAVERDESVPGGLALEEQFERRGAYARSKTSAELALHAALRAHDGSEVEVVIVRPGLVFGRGMVEPLTGTAVELPLGLAVGLGRPDQGVPLLDLRDLNAGLLAVLSRERSPGRLSVFDVLSGTPPAKRDVVRVYRELTGRAGPTLWLPSPLAAAAAEVLERIPPLRRRRRHLGYAVRRLYRFDPSELPHAAFWSAAGLRPRGGVRSALESALPARHLEALAPTPVDGRANARLLLAGARLAGDAPGPPVPLVLVGAGGVVSDFHLPALRRLPRFEVAAVVDRSLELARRAAAEFPGCAAYQDLAEVDGALWGRATAVVATPGYTHGEVAHELLRRGAALVLEKPAASTAAQYASLLELAEARGRPVTVCHNYRLRAGATLLWRFLVEHDVGRLCSATITFHAPPLEAERARWMREEKENRVLLMEQVVHFVDLVCVLGGEIVAVRDARVVDAEDGRATLSFSGTADLASGAELRLDLDLSGASRRFRVSYAFERATCELDFYPDGFRVVPRRAHPLDDLAADASRLTGALAQRLRVALGELPAKALPHYHLYVDHLRSLDGRRVPSAFSLDAVRPTMRSLFRLSELVYGARETIPSRPVEPEQLALEEVAA